MNIGFVSTRLAGTDGVSLETAKLAEILAGRGHEIFYCAGQLTGEPSPTLPGAGAGPRTISLPTTQGSVIRARLIPEIHFTDPVAQSLGARAFATSEEDPALLPDITARAAQLKQPLRRFLDDFQIEYLIVENAFAIPMQLPLAQALAELLHETGLPALAHNHDFYWERERFFPNNIGHFLDTFFPPALPELRHATINSLARRELHRRRGLESVVLPNVFNFEQPAPGFDHYNGDFRREIGLAPDDWLLLQPTRVVPRKGIELALELAARLDDRRAKLVITHEAGDEGLDYLHSLQQQAETAGVDLRYVAGRVGEERGQTAGGRKIYSLWDTYPHADVVTYPSLIEGFGNALLEAVYFRRPLLVNRYDVYKADIAPLGFQFAEIDGAITAEAVATVRGWLEEPRRARPLTEHNYQVARRHFSYGALAERLLPLLPGRP